MPIPFEIADKEAILNEKSEEAASIKGLRILMAEDNELNMEIARTILEDEGVVITAVYNGREAVAKFSSSPAGSFDVILMDIMMPEMDGLTASRIIRGMQRKDAAEIPIIAMTANAFAEDIQAVQNAGMNAHLSKPLEINKLLNTIGRFVNPK